MTWMSSVTTRRWSGRHRIKLGADLQNALAVVHETNRSSIMCATIVPCESKLIFESQNVKQTSKLIQLDEDLLQRFVACASFKVFSIMKIVHLQVVAHISMVVFNFSGNRVEQLGTPYKRGKPCSSCQQSCHSKKIRFVNSRKCLKLIQLNFFPLSDCVWTDVMRQIFGQIVVNFTKLGRTGFVVQTPRRECSDNIIAWRHATATAKFTIKTTTQLQFNVHSHKVLQ